MVVVLLVSKVPGDCPLLLNDPALKDAEALKDVELLEPPLNDAQGAVELANGALEAETEEPLLLEAKKGFEFEEEAAAVAEESPISIIATSPSKLPVYIV